MSSRHLSRSAVLQTLFESDLKDTLGTADARATLERNLEEFGGKSADREFATSLLTGILGKREEIDAVIAASAPQWPLDKIAPIDRNVLRIGLFELLFSDSTIVPPKVALNEAIELAKSFGGDSSGKFINGVLGAVYRSIGSPGKNDSAKNPTPLPHEALGGAVVVSLASGNASIALVHDVFGRWTLPKAKCMDGELSDSAARRAAEEELGFSVSDLSALGEHEYIAHEPDTGRIARTVGYFLAILPRKSSITGKKKAGVIDARWFSEEEVKEIPTYNDLLPILELAFAAAKKA